MNDDMRTHHILLPLLLILLLPCTVVYTIAAAASPSNLAYPTVPDGCTVVSAEEYIPAAPVRRQVYGEGGQIFDISHVYNPNTPVYGSKDGLGEFLWLRASMKNGSPINASKMKLGVHSGTHVDAPGHVFDHYYDAGFDVDALDLHVLNGPAVLVDAPRDNNITAEVMKALNIPKGVRRVLFRTLNTERQLMWKKEFDTSFVGFTKDGAKWLVENTDIKLIVYPTHQVFLEGREIILVEGLKLDGVPAGIYSVHCLPLRLIGADGSPTRCILIK